MKQRAAAFLLKFKIILYHSFVIIFYVSYLYRHSSFKYLIDKELWNLKSKNKTYRDKIKWRYILFKSSQNSISISVIKALIFS